LNFGAVEQEHHQRWGGRCASLRRLLPASSRTGMSVSSRSSALQRHGGGSAQTSPDDCQRHSGRSGLATGIGGEPDCGLAIWSDAIGAGLWNGLSLGFGTNTATTLDEAGWPEPDVSLKAFMKRLLGSSPAAAVVINPASRPEARAVFFMTTPLSSAIFHTTLGGRSIARTAEDDRHLTASSDESRSRCSFEVAVISQLWGCLSVNPGRVVRRAIQRVLTRTWCA
jgi:hypothetical protein